MTGSVFGWLDFSDQERGQMMEIIDLFRVKGTLDELGAAAIRDALSNQLFPGTMTIQTRARYFLFVPWIHFEIERHDVSAGRREEQHRHLHNRLVDSLVAGGETRGIIGIQARQTLKNLPSGIYWGGLNSWTIRLAGESIERYDELRARARSAPTEVLVTESGETIAREHRYWHPAIPDPPADLFERTTFDLTREEAEFLRERIIESCPATLLAGCLTNPIENIDAAGAPWELHGLESLDETVQIDIEYARLFALMAEGAVILYNLAIAERAVEWEISHDEERVEINRGYLNRWADEAASQQKHLESWDRHAFWQRIRELRPTLRPATVRFFDSWIDAAIANPHSLASNRSARELIALRERSLKGRLARLSFRDRLELWSGGSGLGRMTYRWPVAKGHLIDIRDGLNRASETAHA